MGNKSAAIEYYYKALGKCQGNDTMINGTLRNMQSAVGSEEVEKWVMTKLASNPDSLIANIVMFNLVKQKGEYNKALKYLDKAMSIAPQADPQYYRYSIHKANTLVSAFLKTSDKQYLSQAIAEYQSVLKTKPNHTSALNNLAYLLADYTEDYTQAQEYASQAYTVSPNNPNIIDTYAYTLCKTGDYPKAEELLLTAFQLHETQGTAVPSDLYNHLGMAQEGLGQNIKAA
jgi:tetratricopeptide (TPR) repeat protein